MIASDSVDFPAPGHPAIPSSSPAGGGQRRGTFDRLLDRQLDHRTRAGLHLSPSSSRRGGWAPTRVQLTAATSTAATTAARQRIAVVQVGTTKTGLLPPCRERSAEGIACADRVDHLHSRHRYLD